MCTPWCELCLIWRGRSKIWSILPKRPFNPTHTQCQPLDLRPYKFQSSKKSSLRTLSALCSGQRYHHRLLTAFRQHSFLWWLHTYVPPSVPRKSPWIMRAAPHLWFRRQPRPLTLPNQTKPSTNLHPLIPVTSAHNPTP